MLNVTTVVNHLKKSPIESVKTLINNRKAINQELLDFIVELSPSGIEITKDNMGASTWYYIKRNGQLVGAQFFWNEGAYNAEGVHSLYDEYGYSVK